MRRDGLDMGCPRRRSVGLLGQEVHRHRLHSGVRAVGVCVHFHCVDRMNGEAATARHVILYMVSALFASMVSAFSFTLFSVLLIN